MSLTFQVIITFPSFCYLAITSYLDQIHGGRPARRGPRPGRARPRLHPRGAGARARLRVRELRPVVALVQGQRAIRAGLARNLRRSLE